MEFEALKAMFDTFERTSEASIRFRVDPGPDDSGRACGTAMVEAVLPPGYPASARPELRIVPGPELEEGLNVEALTAAAMAAVAETEGSEAMWAVSEAVRDWLREHGALPEKPEAQVEQKPDEDDGSDISVDSSDLDEELIEALEDIVEEDAARMKELKRLRRLGSCAEQRVGLRAFLRTLSPMEREELLASDSESEDEAAAAATGGGSAKSSRGGPALVMPKAARECPAGHELTSYSARPPDYKKFDGDEFTCDVCGQDGFYRNGVYHCTKCFQKGGKQFDACYSCGISTGAPSPAKKQQNKAKKR